MQRVVLGGHNGGVHAATGACCVKAREGAVGRVQVPQERGGEYRRPRGHRGSRKRRRDVVGRRRGATGCIAARASFDALDVMGPRLRGRGVSGGETAAARMSQLAKAAEGIGIAGDCGAGSITALIVDVGAVRLYPSFQTSSVPCALCELTSTGGGVKMGGAATHLAPALGPEGRAAHRRRRGGRCGVPCGSPETKESCKMLVTADYSESTDQLA